MITPHGYHSLNSNVIAMVAMITIISTVITVTSHSTVTYVSMVNTLIKVISDVTRNSNKEAINIYTFFFLCISNYQQNSYSISFPNPP
jgi:uncharacterized Tic20 family protein